MHDAVVIGAGPGGLAAAAMLKSKAGLKDVVVLERAGSVGASWRAHYDRLHLHTVRWLSHLPGYRIPRRCGRWVARDDVVRYLEAYAVHHRLDIRFGVEALRIDRTARAKAAAGTQAGAAAVREPPADAWCIATSAGEMEARCVIVATGHNHTPHIPEWPGRAEFPGELLHASKYRNAAPYEGKKVLVVGAGNTGAEIAVDLVEGGACSVWVAVRTPPHVIRREAFGVPSLALGVLIRRLPARVVDPVAAAMRKLTVGDLSPYGLGQPGKGLYTRILEDDAIPLVDVGFIACLKRGEVKVVGAVQKFDGPRVLLSDGASLTPNAVIAATGYKPDLDALVGHLGLLDERGRPVVRGGRTATHAPHLYFTGYTNPISGMFRELNIDARRIARAVREERGPRPAVGPQPSLPS